MGRPMTYDALYHLFLGFLDNLRTEYTGIVGLGRLGDPRAVEPLCALLDGEHESWVCTALGQIGDVRAINPLLARVHRAECNGKPIAYGLRDLLPLLEVDELLKLLAGAPSSPDCYDVRIDIVRALGEKQDSRAVEPLLTLFAAEQSDTLYCEIENALGLIGSAAALESVLQAWRQGYPLDLTAVRRLLTTESVEALLKRVSAEKDLRLRAVTIQALGDLRDSAAVPTLLQLLETATDRDTRRSIAEALGAIGDRTCVDVLMPWLGTEKDKFVRRRLADALGEARDLRAIEVLIDALRQETRSQTFKLRIVRSLQYLCTERDEEAIRSCFFHETDKSVADRLFEVLRTIHQTEESRTLLSEYSDFLGDEYYREYVIPALDVDSLLAHLTDAQDSWNDDCILKELGAVGDERAVPVLIKHLLDPDLVYKSSAAEALGKIGRRMRETGKE